MNKFFILFFVLITAEVCAQEELQVSTSQETIADLESQIQEIEEQKQQHLLHKEALAKQLHVHNQRTFKCNGVRIQKAKKCINKHAVDGDFENKKNKAISELKDELSKTEETNNCLLLLKSINNK